MEKIWENRCALGEEQYLQMAALSWTAGKKLCLFSGVALFALLAAALLCVPLPGSSGLGAISGVLALLLLATACFLPKQVSRAAYRKLCRKNGSLAVKTTMAGQGGLSWYEPGEDRVAFSYRQVKRCRETAFLFLLELEDGVTIPLDKQGFLEGTPEEWKKWMQAQNAAIRWERPL